MKGDYFAGGNEKIFGCRVECSPIPRVSLKGSGDGGTVHTWCLQQSSIKGGNIFGKKRDTWGIILGDNPAGYCFLLRDLVPSSFFK